MLNLSHIEKAARNPSLILKGVNNIGNRAFHTRLGCRDYNPAGINIFEEDWDNLLILDACRYDLFSDRASTLPGDLDYRISRGSHSKEFVKANFMDKRLHDVVYLSTNLFYATLQPELGAEIHRFISVHEEENWEDIHPTTPDLVTKHAKRTADEYPNKRLIVHYIQPHSPYIGPTGKKHFGSTDTPSAMWDRNNSELTDEILQKAYCENLDMVLEDVRELLEYLPGKTVVTADHGELLGERCYPIPLRNYGHPLGVYVEELVKVPWHSYQNGSRKRIVPEPPTSDSQSDISDEYVQEQLKNLGYYDG